MKKSAVLAGLALFLLGFAWGQNRRLLDISGAVDWDKGELDVSLSLDLDAAGLRLPSGRIQAEEIIEKEYAALIRPFLLALQADSSSTLGDLVQRGELSLEELDRLSIEGKRVPPSLSTDLSRMNASYSIGMGAVRALFKRTQRPAETVRPVMPVPAADYSGIIIIASEELPVHGRNTRALAVPCIFPKIHDTEMKLIYDRSMADPAAADSEAGRSGGRPLVSYASEAAIFQPGPSGLDESLAKLAGPKPLRILARGIYGQNPTDLVIDREDALLISSSENNRRLLRESRVVFVLNNSVLKVPFGANL